MARVLRMPGVAANATDAVLSEWLVEESADFAAADAIATVETEKAAVDVEADAAGRVLKTLVPPGAQVEVGDPIAVLGDPGEQVDDLEALLTSLGVAQATDVVVPERREVPEPAADGRVFASPLARKLAKDAGLGIEEITGTGPRGRVLRRDVEAARATRDTATPSASPAVVSRPRSRNATYDEVPHSRIRRATARRLTESQQQAPHFYVRATVRAEALLALRAEINGDETIRISLNDLVVKAVGAAHERVPEMNVTWTPDAVRRYRTVDVAVAVATDRGLLTPVVRDVGATTISALTTSIRDLTERARAGRLTQDDLEGGSISVTNLGMYGVEEFAAIINPPHAAILAVGSVRDEPVVEDGVVVPGRVMTLTLSVDHRPVDGVVAARWLAVLEELLEHPARILA
ncbi:MAG TPA: dihydrolipoamide acetyltransferase family protein [Nocardioides sp.]|nr:dihydrolipoamide acetyltransferase family protein [Nocardioides sp.]